MEYLPHQGTVLPVCLEQIGAAQSLHHPLEIGSWETRTRSCCYCRCSLPSGSSNIFTIYIYIIDVSIYGYPSLANHFSRNWASDGQGPICSFWAMKNHRRARWMIYNDVNHMTYCIYIYIIWINSQHTMSLLNIFPETNPMSKCSKWSKNSVSVKIGYSQS